MSEPEIQSNSRRKLLIAAAVILALLIGATAVKHLRSLGSAGLQVKQRTISGQESSEQANAEGRLDSERPLSTTRLGRLSSSNTTRGTATTDGNQNPRAPSSAFAGATADATTAERAAHRRQLNKLMGYSPDRVTPEAELEPDIREMVSRTKNDMRSMATGIESYYVDNNTYPFTTTNSAAMPVHAYSFDGRPVPGPMTKYPDGPASLSTPIAYVTSFFPDPFARITPDTFAYYSPDPNGWVLFSPGPDGKYDFIWELYTSAVAQPSTELIAFMYDPTNGLLSSGDIIRVKQ